MADLNESSREFAERLFAAYPDWRSHSKVESDGSLSINVSPPTGSDINHPFWISTENDEVTVGLDHYHAHFDWPPSRFSEPVWQSDAMAFIAALFNEDVAVVSYWNGEKWAGSTAVERGHAVDLDKAEGMRVRVRSWEGSRNQDIVVGPTAR